MSQQPCGSLFRGLILFGSGARVEAWGLTLPFLPDRAGGFPLLVSVVSAVSELSWINERGDHPISMPEHFEFCDIGCGVPDRIIPPDDWTID